MRTSLEELADSDDPDAAALDLATVVVVNDWTVVRFGHRDHAERELALSIAERNRARRRTRITTTTREAAA